MTFSIVIPTIGRRSLGALLESLDRCSGPRPQSIVIVDDRRERAAPLPRSAGWTAQRTEVRRSGGRGPAAARNTGWRATTPAVKWVVFLDDDVLVTPDWLDDLSADVYSALPGVAGSQARLAVPLPSSRRATDWERGTAGLATARWITADMAYRRRVLEEVGGFDERFPRAFREDADIALRVVARGYQIDRGRRTARHPVRPAPWNASLRQQRGNADDALMRRLHGPGWYQRSDAEPGRRPMHLLTTAAAVLTVAAAVVGRGRSVPAGAAAVWLALTGRFAWTRIAPGPRTPGEIGAMLATSVAIPPAAAWHWLRGSWRHRGAEPWPLPLRAVLLDRDGTLVRDVPYNGDPALVEALPGVENALRRLREAGLGLAVVSNQSGIARGVLRTEQVAAVNARVEQLLGPFATWQICPHGDADGCHCRKPEPGLMQAAAHALGLTVQQCAVIGDIGADIQAAAAAGAQLAVLVPTPATRPEEVDAAEFVCPDLDAAAEVILARVTR
jgi:histidinol-phosphate phosphatase family protein